MSNLLERAIYFLFYFVLRVFNRYNPRDARYRHSQLKNFRLFRKVFPRSVILKEIVNRARSNTHAASPELIQFWFASNELFKVKPKSILDIGSHLSWLYGICGFYNVKTLDVRPRELKLLSEVSLVGEAQNLPLKSKSEECITSLSAIEHFGLGSYADRIDVYGDVLAINEISRVLQKGGSFIFTTTLTKNNTFIVFNTRKVYSFKDIRALLEKDFKLENEAFFSKKLKRIIDYELVSSKVGPRENDLYLGHWVKI